MSVENKSALHALAEEIGSHVAQMANKYDREIADLKARLAEVETRGLRYRGIWQRADEYKRGDATTCDASLWIGVVDNPTCKPGDGSDWQLAVPGGGRR